jgi:hypothetical protein
LTAVPSDALNPDDPEAGEANKDLVNLYTGLKMTEEILMGTLKKHGLERFDPTETGGKFDPRLHDATFQTKVEGKEDGDVFHTQSKGYMLNGRVLRVSPKIIFTSLDADIVQGCESWCGQEFMSGYSTIPFVFHGHGHRSGVYDCILIFPIGLWNFIHVTCTKFLLYGCMFGEQGKGIEFFNIIQRCW